MTVLQVLVVISNNTLSTGVSESRRERLRKEENWGFLYLVLPSCKILLKSRPDVVGFLSSERFSVSWQLNLCLNTAHGKWWSREVTAQYGVSVLRFFIFYLNHCLQASQATVPGCKMAFTVLGLIWLGRIKVTSESVRPNGASFARCDKQRANLML